MFPLTSNEAYIKSTGERSTLGRMLEEGGNQPVEDKLNDEIAARAELGAHNRLPYPYYETTKSDNNVTFTDLGDGSIKIDSTGATAQTTFLCIRRSQEVSESLVTDWKATQYKVLGATTEFKIKLDWYDASNNYISSSDYTSDGKITPATNAKYVNFFIVVPEGGTADDVIVYPQVVLATDAATEFTPYAMTNQELSKYSRSSSNSIVIERLGRVVHLYSSGVVATGNVVGQTVVSDTDLRTKTQIMGTCILRDSTTLKYNAHPCTYKTDGTIVFLNEDGTNISDTTNFDYCTFDITYFI